MQENIINQDSEKNMRHATSVDSGIGSADEAIDNSQSRTIDSTILTDSSIFKPVELNNITINLSDLEQHINTNPIIRSKDGNHIDPITNLIDLNSQIHVPGLKALYDDLQSSSLVTLEQLKQKHAKALLSDLEQLSKLYNSEVYIYKPQVYKCPTFNQEFYQQILKAPIERSPEYNEEYNNLINKHLELPNKLFLVAKNSAKALLEFDKEGQTLENFRKNFLSAMQEFKDSLVNQTKIDLDRSTILYKGSDNKVRRISLEELKESKDIALSGEQRDFIATSWHQSTFDGGMMWMYLANKNVQDETMFPLPSSRTQIIIDVSDGVKIHNRVYMKSRNPDGLKIPYCEMGLSVDISNMKGDKFMQGCSPKPQIAINMNFLDKETDFYFPGELKNIMKFSDAPVAIDNIRKEAIQGYIQMRGWNKLSEEIDSDKAFTMVVQEVLDWQEDNIPKEQVINDIIGNMIAPSKEEKYNHTLEPQQAVQLFCEVETDTIWREKIASKCLDLFFQKQPSTSKVLDSDTHKSIKKSVISILLPLCSSDAEKKNVEKNVGQMIRECAIEQNIDLSWAEAWKNFKNKISHVISYLTGKETPVQKLRSQHREITRTLDTNFSAKYTNLPNSKIKVGNKRDAKHMAR